MAVLVKPATSEFEMPRQHMTETEFVAWCDEDTHAEWIDGEVIVASPASATHVRLVKFLLQVLDGFVRLHHLGEVLGPELQIRFGALRHRRVPDLFFVATARANIIQRNHIEGAPDLIVEIVSPDSLARDWRDKYLEYEAMGVREYWIVDAMAERVEIYALDAHNRYARIEERDDAIHSIVLPGFFLRPDWLWQEPLPHPFTILRELNAL